MRWQNVEEQLISNSLWSTLWLWPFPLKQVTNLQTTLSLFSYQKSSSMLIQNSLERSLSWLLSRRLRIRIAFETQWTSTRVQIDFKCDSASTRTPGSRTGTPLPLQVYTDSPYFPAVPSWHFLTWMRHKNSRLKKITSWNDYVWSS